MINSFFYLFFFTFLSLISVYGYSKTFIYLFKIENKIFSNFRIIEFFLVLFFLVFILIIISFFSSINDYLSYIFYFFGSILYFIYFFKIKNKSKEFQFNIIADTIPEVSVLSLDDPKLTSENPFFKAYETSLFDYTQNL